MKIFKYLSILGLSLGFLMASGTSSAQGLCSAGTNDAAIDESDVTWTYDGSSQDADDCYGLISNDDAATVDGAFGGSWTELAKSDNIGDGGTLSDTGSYMGIDFTLTNTCDGGCASSSGTYTLSWTDPGATDLPLTFDFVVALKGSNDGALYLFDDITISASPAEGGGDWEINWAVNANNSEPPNISHLTIYVRDGSTDMPEPGTLSLLGLGLLGIGLSRRRKAQA